MARKKQKAHIAEQDRELLHHIQSLGLVTVEEYQDWCVDHGFSRRLKKHSRQRRRERECSDAIVAWDRLSRRKREKHVGAIVGEICQGHLQEQDVGPEHLKRLCGMLRHNKAPTGEREVDRDALRQLAELLYHSRAKVFDETPVVSEFGRSAGNTYVEALAHISAHSRSWVRPLKRWKCRSHAPRRQFASLLRHLFVKYEMPAFFDTVWFMSRSKQSVERRRWYLHIGRGQNIRHCHLPIRLTKRMAHHFMQAPADLTFEQALRWGHVHGLGAEGRLARELIRMPLTGAFAHQEFWESVIRWFVRYMPEGGARVGPIIDYLQHQRFVPEGYFVDRPTPPQPNLTMNGRTPAALWRQVEEWHRRLADDNVYQVRQWEPSGIEQFDFTEGDQTSPSFKVWTIRELTGSKALFTEGRRMRHCVASYAPACASGEVSIWTMEYESCTGLAKALTLEVRNAERLICQARGRSNRPATERERGIIRRWAEKAGLKLAPYA